MVALLRSLTTTHCAWLHAEYKALITEALRGAGVCSDNNDESHVWVDLLPCSEAAHWDENQPEAAVIAFSRTRRPHGYA
jgi:deoxycytidylate deaminase